MAVNKSQMTLSAELDNNDSHHLHSTIPICHVNSNQPDQKSRSTDDSANRPLTDADSDALDHETFQALIDRAKLGDEEAISGLYDASRKYLLLIANQDLHPQALQKFGASDVVQQSMIVASNKIGDFRGTTRAEFFAWMRQILVNECRQSTRHYLGTEKRNTNRERSTTENAKKHQGYHEAVDPHLTPSTKAATDEQIDLIRSAIQSLPKLDRQVIEMRNWQNLPFEQIGLAIGKSSEAARKIWSRAVLTLEQELRKMDAL